MDNRINFRLGVPGHHWAVNSLGVLASVAAVGGSVGEATVSMAGFHAPKGRGDTHVVPVKGGQITVIDESYNASPVSMCAVFRVLGQLQPGQGGRRIAALGDMLELGDDSAERHAALADALEENDIDLVFTAGSHMASLDGALSESMRGGHADNSTDAIQMLTDTVQAGDIVLVKGSAGSRMGLVVDALLNLADGSSKQAGGGR